MDQYLKHLPFNSAPKAEHREPDTGRDRKRLKERLKRAAMKDSIALQRVGFLEYVFGICAGDQRMGKEGSRCARTPCTVRPPSPDAPIACRSLIHPTSPFMQGFTLPSSWAACDPDSERPSWGRVIITAITQLQSPHSYNSIRILQ
jgi:hypothetical protein